MIKKILNVFARKEDPAASTVRLDAISRWIRGQKRDEVQNHINMLVTVFKEFPELLNSFHKKASELDEARLRVEDFPDAHPSIVRIKRELASEAKKIIEDMQIIADQQTNDLDEYENSYEQLKQQADILEKIIKSKGSTLKPYFLDNINTLSEHFALLKSLLGNVHDVLTGPALEAMHEIKVHANMGLEKLQKRKDIKEQIAQVQAKIDAKYKDFLHYETKIREIQESKRYKLETTLPKDRRSSPIGHFSVLEQEIKELSHRKKSVQDTLNKYNEERDALQQRYEDLAIDKHIDRIQLLVHQLARTDLEIIYEDV